jgi:ribosomal protein S18 acetylase RimI-like enzyme
VEIRKIKSNEGLMLRDARLSALADSPYAFGATLSEEKRKPVNDFYSTAKAHSASETSTTFFAIENNSAVGQIGAFFDSVDGESFICAMWVAPSHRRKGLGEQLISKAISWLTQRNASKICAWVANSNMVAIKFYQSVGFVSSRIQQALPSNLETKETLFIYEEKNG